MNSPEEDSVMTPKGIDTILTNRSYPPYPNAENPASESKSFEEFSSSTGTDAPVCTRMGFCLEKIGRFLS